MPATRDLKRVTQRLSMADRDPPSPSPSPSACARAERRAAAAALAAELGHELQGPLNLFRLSAERLSRGEALDQEEVASLGEELERLSRLNARLRELARTPLQKRACTPQQLVELALSKRHAASGGGLGLGVEVEVEVETADLVTISCDPALISQALGELFDNAREAKTERAGVRFEVEPTPGFCVWDDGPGFELGAENSLAWGATTRPGAAGLGLTLALRVARAHGFSLELRRVSARTEAWLIVPARELNPKESA
jgi:two-component system, OmpR family, sensor histidine kinase CreC